MRKGFSSAVVLAALLVLTSSPSLPAQGEAAAARLSFTKSFKGSVPEYIHVVVAESGEATYQGGTIDEKAEPVSFRVSDAVTQHLFKLAAQLNYFRSLTLDESADVANMGEKIFVYEGGGRRHQVSYNYTRNPAAEELQRLCEGLGLGRYWIAQLEFRRVFDKLGVLGTLRAFERDLNGGRLAAVEQFVPVLERIERDTRVMQLARSRARELLRRLQRSGARLLLEFGDQRAGWYHRLVVEEGGAATLESRRFQARPNPKPVTLPARMRERFLELARLANYFRGTASQAATAGMPSGYRLAYENGPEHNEVAFSTATTAVLAEFVHLFSQVVKQERWQERLGAAVKENTIELQTLLMDFETALQKDRLAEPAAFAPLLEGVASGSQFHAVVQQLAARLLARIRGGQPPTPTAQ